MQTAMREAHTAGPEARESSMLRSAAVGSDLGHHKETGWLAHDAPRNVRLRRKFVGAPTTNNRQAYSNATLVFSTMSISVFIAGVLAIVPAGGAVVAGCVLMATSAATFLISRRKGHENPEYHNGY
jgi:hypothetical protein